MEHKLSPAEAGARIEGDVDPRGSRPGLLQAVPTGGLIDADIRATLCRVNEIPPPTITQLFSTSDWSYLTLQPAYATLRYDYASLRRCEANLPRRNVSFLRFTNGWESSKDGFPGG